MVDLARIAVPPVLVEDAKRRTCVVSRYTIFSLSPADDARAMVQRLVIIAHGPSVATSPSVLVVPRALLKCMAAWPDLLADLQGVEAQLATKGARIIWYESDYPHDLVPPEFLRYARELKAERRAREEEAQEAQLFYYLSHIMADRVPDEILLAIFDELASSRPRGSGTSPSENKEVQRALVMACLTSRRLRKIAQPVLWRRVVLSSGKQLEGILSTGAAASLGQYTRYYAVESDAYDLSVAPGRLSLSSIATTAEDVRTWICPEHMPALRVLHVEVILAVGARWALLDELVAPAILAQLDVVRTHWEELHRVPYLVSSVELANSVAPPILVHRQWSAPFSLPRHTLFSLSASHEAEAMVKDLDEIAHGTSIGVSVSPSVLVLPKSLLTRTAASPDVVAELQGLEAQLATKGARIIWYEDDYPHDLVPPEFLRYARELKAARRAREEEKEERRA
ncbi:hypothetical protein JCM9279_006541 [Rhodotorula babjevae]